MTLNNGEQTTKFINNLQQAVDTESREIRETDLSSTHPIGVSVNSNGKTLHVMASVDALGRIHLPYRRDFLDITSIRIGEENKKVVRVETRHKNDNPVACVCYF